jgi:hypothetical protein
MRCFGCLRFGVALLGTRNLFFLKKYHKNFPASGRLVNGRAAPTAVVLSLPALAEMFR